VAVSDNAVVVAAAVVVVSIGVVVLAWHWGRRRDSLHLVKDL
jgi:hypothetical protein